MTKTDQSAPRPPSKLIRRNSSSTSGGGLTPLPYDSDDCYMSIAGQSDSKSPYDTRASSAQPHPDSAAQHLYSIESVQQELIATSAEKADDGDGEVKSDSLSVTDHALNAHGESVNERLQQALLKIRETDAVLRQKALLAKSLMRKRLSRNNSAQAKSNLEEHGEDEEGEPDEADFDSSEDEEDEELELRSVHSMETRTFITEPKLGTRTRISGPSHRNVAEPPENTEQGSTEKATKKKGYKLGDFIERNIALGPEARYYSALTEEESERVEHILQAEDEAWEETGNGMFDETLRTPNMPTRPWTSASGFSPETDDFNRLAEIDRQLQLILPEADWEAKSVVWSTNNSVQASGMQTPVNHLIPRHSIRDSAPPQPVRDIASVLHSAEALRQTEEIFRMEQKRLEEIDEKLAMLSAEHDVDDR
ncbi:fibrous sheath-interacting protein 1 [Phlyctochytrium arcticum]|nr:fibrous sheath-interacting protein 1 [Phlyctochytrium arcticum]